MNRTHCWFPFLVIRPHLCVAIGLESQNARVLDPSPVNGILGWFVGGVLFHEHIILNWNHSRIGQFDHVLCVDLQSINKETILISHDEDRILQILFFEKHVESSWFQRFDEHYIRCRYGCYIGWK